MKNIVLTGFMGTGKTTIGKALANMLQMKFVDVDEEIESAQKMTIDDIFRIYGERHFRDIETAMIRKVSQGKNSVISTGGGAVLRAENMEALRKNGIIFCLNARAETILKRTGSSQDRPLLKTDNPEEKINELLAFRGPFYEKAGIVVETDDKSPSQIAEDILEIIKWRK